MASLKLRFNPYTYTRVQVMRTLLLKAEDYERLLKMSFSEIAQYLSKTSYRKQIEALGLKYSGAELLERAIAMNIVETFQKLRKISDEALRKAVNTYLLREDFHNLKILARAMASGIPSEEALSVAVPAGVLSMDDLKLLSKESSIKTLLAKSKLVQPETLKRLFEGKQPTLLEIENALDREYFLKVLEFCDSLQGEGSAFKSFLMEEMDIVNLITIIRARNLELKPEETLSLLVPPGRHLSRATLSKMAHAASNAALLSFLKGTPHYKVTEPFLKGEKPLMFLKTRLQKELLSRSLRVMHRDMLSVNVILAFMLSKEIEAKNLKVLIKGKQLNMPSETIKEELVHEA